VLGDSDNTRFEIIIILTVGHETFLLFWYFFLAISQIILYPAKAYHSQTKNIKVIFDFGGRFFAIVQEKKNSNKNEKLITMR